MAKKDPIPSTAGVSYHTRLDAKGKPRKNKDGSLSILTLVRVGRFKPVSKTFKTMEEAEAWAAPLAKKLGTQQDKPLRRNSTQLTIGELIQLFLAVPDVRSLKRYDSYCDWANWWSLHFGTKKVLDVDPHIADEGKAKLQERRNWSAASINRHLAIRGQHGTGVVERS